MMNAVAATDLHGNPRLYELLLRIADAWKISSVFLAGDLSPALLEPADAGSEGIEAMIESQREFFERVFCPLFEMFLVDHRRTHVYAITGNDDRRANEGLLFEFGNAVPNFHFLNDRLTSLHDAQQIRTFFPGEVPDLAVAGYPYVPPGAGLLLDWVKAEDRVGLLPPGMDPCMSIEQSGIRTASQPPTTTIEEDLADFGAHVERHGVGSGDAYDPSRTIHLFHSPPYNTPLDHVAPQGRYDYLGLPDHVGSTAIRAFIERNQPPLVICGHCHEAVVLGNYKADIGRSRCINPGSQTHIDVLSVVQFNAYDTTEMKQFFIHAR
jgi:Icc-related predicted phosphoesterase